MKRSRFTLSAVAACSAASLLLGTVAGAADAPVSIPVIMPLTGGGAFIGQTQQKSLQILEGLVKKTAASKAAR
jgi:hypothetical protein